MRLQSVADTTNEADTTYENVAAPAAASNAGSLAFCGVPPGGGAS